MSPAESHENIRLARPLSIDLMVDGQVILLFCWSPELSGGYNKVNTANVDACTPPGGGMDLVVSKKRCFVAGHKPLHCPYDAHIL